MNAMQKTRFYLFMSLVAHAASIIAYAIGIASVLLDIGVFFFARYTFQPTLLWGGTLVIAGGRVEGWCANQLVKQYGARA